MPPRACSRLQPYSVSMDNIAWFGVLMTFLYVVVVPIVAINAGLAVARAESGRDQGVRELDARDPSEAPR